MGNGNHRNWGNWIKEESFAPESYEPTEQEAEILALCLLGDPEGKIMRQSVSFAGVEIGFIQIGHGFGESYVVKPVDRIGLKIRCPKDKAVINLVKYAKGEGS